MRADAESPPSRTLRVQWWLWLGLVGPVLGGARPGGCLRSQPSPGLLRDGCWPRQGWSPGVRGRWTALRPDAGGWASTCSVLHGAELRPGLVPAGTPQAGRAPWVAVQLSRAQRCWGEGLGGGTWGAGHWRWELVETPLGPRSQIESCNKGVGERFLARRPFF